MRLNKLGGNQTVKSFNFFFYDVVYNIEDSRYQNIRVLLIINNNNKN